MSESDSVVFKCVCDEPEGTVIRTVRHIAFTPENIQRLYQVVSKFPTFMGNEIHSMEDMLRIFVSEDGKGGIIPKGLCLIVDDFIGIFWLTDINQLLEASVHYSFFDRRHRGRVELCKKALEFCFSRFQFHRLHTSVPVYANRVMAFVESLGFMKYGRSRRNKFFRGKYYDVQLYDILKEEFLNGNIKHGELRTADNSSIESGESA